MTYAQIISKWETCSDLASDLGVSAGLVRAWRHRDKIPSAYWLDVARAAEGRGFKGVTLDALATIAASGRESEDA